MSIIDDIINALAKKKIARLTEDRDMLKAENLRLREENSQLRLKLRKYGFAVGPLSWK